MPDEKTEEDHLDDFARETVAGLDLPADFLEQAEMLIRAIYHADPVMRERLIEQMPDPAASDKSVDRDKDIATRQFNAEMRRENKKAKAGK